MGILLEADYKGILSGRDGPLIGLRKVLDGRPPTAASSSPSSSSTPSPPKHGASYEAMNRDSAILAAKTAAEAGVDAFAFISAAASAPGLPSRYLSTKREAEQVLTAASADAASALASGFSAPLHRPVFVRAPFLYDMGARPISVPVAALAGAGSVVNRLSGGMLKGLLGTMATKPLRVDEVAEAVIEALSDASVGGAIEVEQIEELANRAWRKGML